MLGRNLGIGLQTVCERLPACRDIAMLFQIKQEAERLFDATMLQAFGALATGRVPLFAMTRGDSHGGGSSGGSGGLGGSPLSFTAVPHASSSSSSLFPGSGGGGDGAEPSSQLSALSSSLLALHGTPARQQLQQPPRLSVSSSLRSTHKPTSFQQLHGDSEIAYRLAYVVRENAKENGGKIMAADALKQHHSQIAQMVNTKLSQQPFPSRQFEPELVLQGDPLDPKTYVPVTVTAHPLFQPLSPRP